MGPRVPVGLDAYLVVGRRAYGLLCRAVLKRAWFVILMLCAWPAIAVAQDQEAQSEADAATKSAARELGRRGIELYEAGSYEEAFDKLARAHALVGLTTTGLWRARCLVALGRLVEASEALFAVTRMGLPLDAQPVHVDAQRLAAEERQALLPRIPRLVIRIDGEIPDDIVVTLDGHAVPPALVGVKQPVDPGAHLLEARGAGTSASQPIELAEGQVLEVPIRLVDRDGSPRRRDRAGVAADAHETPLSWTIGWVALGVGGAGLIVGAVTGGLASNKSSDLDESCPLRSCPPELHADVDTFETLRLASTIGFIAGGVVTATGIVLVITGAVAGDDEDAPTASLRLTPTGLFLEGRF